MKTKSQAMVMKTKYELNKEQIMENIGVDSVQYNVFMNDVAMQWVRSRILNDEDVLNKITEQPDFWMWWINQWNLREDAFLRLYSYFTVPGGFEKFLHPEWLKIHDISNINVLIPEVVLKNVVKAIEAEQRKEAGNA
jgi:hypothetical protein